MAEVKARLATDDAAVAQHNIVGPRLQAAQAAHDRAGALAELMGSADGSKFRVFAQSLTLDVLIGHANAHLAVLQPRYRLLRLNDVRARLEMAVVDGHAGDEVRALSSLSGGETFLMSLALALGLSSLQSQRSVVESLFIDEGFSSLDPDTLEVALAAFEALKLGGRQVTVISHVPALSERLGAPIRVIPQGAGRSRVEVG
jgi:exonuclease SbcC